MKTTAPANESVEASLEKHYCNSKIELSLQQMFDEFMVFISKTDLE